jgi:hypothetical protein
MQNLKFAQDFLLSTPSTTSDSPRNQHPVAETKLSEGAHIPEIFWNDLDCFGMPPKQFSKKELFVDGRCLEAAKNCNGESDKDLGSIRPCLFQRCRSTSSLKPYRLLYNRAIGNSMLSSTSEIGPSKSACVAATLPEKIEPDKFWNDLFEDL